MKNTPFKMKGFSGFGNSPLRDTEPHTGEDPPGHTHDTVYSPPSPKASMMGSHVYHEKGYTDVKKKKKKSKGNLGYKFMKFLGLTKGRKQQQNLKFWCSGDDC
jgi:hypothetical protein